MQRLSAARGAVRRGVQPLWGLAAVGLLLAGAPALGQTTTNPGNRTMPPRPDAVRPNSQNLMQGPSYWTPQQRRLNVPGATSNPSLRRDTGAYPPPPLPPAPPPLRPSASTARTAWARSIRRWRTP